MVKKASQDRLSNSKPQTIAHLIGGFSGGVLSTISLHPFELLKTRLAVNDGSGSENIRHRYNGVLHAIRVIYRDGGVKSFYQGVTPNLIGASISWGVFLFLYERFKSELQSRYGNSTLTLSQQVLSASASGVITLSFMNPIWVVKTRMILQTQEQAGGFYYRNVRDALSKIWRTEGIHGLYRGYLAGVLGVSHGVVQIVSYDCLKRAYRRRTNTEITSSLSAYLALSAVSKVFAVSTTYPYQVVRFRIQSKNEQYRGVLQSAKLIARNEGVHGFYKGLLPSILRVTPATCVTMVVYEYALILHRHLTQT